MGKFIDLTEQKFGKLCVIRRTSNNQWGKSMWLCRCDCGRELIICAGNLRSGKSKSCGCDRTKHGHGKSGPRSKLYGTWLNVNQRCNNPNYRDYRHYGGKGITVCDRWKNFQNFAKDMGEPLAKNHSIDRINNNMGYNKTNCRWATKKEQSRNRRDNYLVTFNGETKCLAAWAEETGIEVNTIKKRLKLEWPIEKALTIPQQRGKNET